MKNWISQSPNEAPEAAPGITPTILVSGEAWAAAWIAFYDALGIEGVSALDVFSDGMTCDGEGMRVVLGVRVPGVEPIVIGDPTDGFAVWGWPVRIERKALG